MNKTEFDALEEAYFKAKSEKEKIDRLPKNRRLAIRLHDMMCLNKQNGLTCDWFYEIDNDKHDWGGHEHQRWLEKADKILELTNDVELIENVVSIIHR